MAQPLETTSLHAVLVNKAHLVAATCLFVRKSAGTGDNGNNLEHKGACSFVEIRSRWDSVAASSGIKLIVILLLLPEGLSSRNWSSETLPYGTHGTDLPVGPCSEAGMLPPIFWVLRSVSGPTWSEHQGPFCTVDVGTAEETSWKTSTDLFFILETLGSCCVPATTAYLKASLCSIVILNLKHLGHNQLIRIICFNFE